MAKYLCTSTFLSKRNPEIVFTEDIKPVNPLARVVRWQIDRVDQSVSAEAFTAFQSKAIYRQGCGCTLVVGTTEAALRRQPICLPEANQASPASLPTLPWPQGSAGPIDPQDVGVNPTRLTEALDNAFTEPGAGNLRQTRAVAIVYQGQLIAERYAPGFGPDMPMQGWSMSKGVTNALVGLLVGQGRLAIEEPAPVPEWRTHEDARNQITLDQLLRMSSGLAFDEVYRPMADVTKMLFGSHDFAAFAASSHLEAPPDEKWHYASGTANIIARIVRNEAEKTVANYYRFVRESFFDRIGMRSAVMEPDPSGTIVGSSYTAATVRDWATSVCFISRTACGTMSGSCLKAGSNTPPPPRPRPLKVNTALCSGSTPANRENLKIGCGQTPPRMLMPPRDFRNRRSSSFRPKDWYWCALAPRHPGRPGTPMRSSPMCYGRCLSQPAPA